MNRLEKTCIASLISLPIAISTIALGFLSAPPSLSCNYMDQQAVVSVRVHCAQQQAQRGTPESLAAAIKMLETVPADDPFHQQCDRLVQRWSTELLAMAEVEVQAGNLDKGISIVRSLAQDAKVRSWKSLWQNGEAVMKTAIEQTEKRQWRQAFQTASQLRQFENEYWATEQYNALIHQIQSDREFRDWTLRNPVEPRKQPKEVELNLPKPSSIVRSTRSLWKVQDDAPISRPVNVVKPKPEIISEPTPQVQPPPELEPEPPVEVVPPQSPQVEIPVSEPEKNGSSASLRVRT